MASTDENRRILVDWLDASIVRITINRPEALNSLTRPMMRQLAQAFKQIRLEGKAKAIILTGAGRAFCAGVDLTAAQAVFQGDVADEEADVVVQMERCAIPVIGAINGHAITAGFEIALACDILIASRNARFADTHAKFGIFPSWGLSQKLSRLIGVNRARHVSLTAQPIDGETAERWGLVSLLVGGGGGGGGAKRGGEGGGAKGGGEGAGAGAGREGVGGNDELLSAAHAVAKAISANHSSLVRQYKAVINEGHGMALREGRQLETDRARAYYKQMTPDDFRKMREFIAGRSGKAKL